jgi:hypothetical protein
LKIRNEEREMRVRKIIKNLESRTKTTRNGLAVAKSLTKFIN